MSELLGYKGYGFSSFKEESPSVNVKIKKVARVWEIENFSTKLGSPDNSKNILESSCMYIRKVVNFEIQVHVKQGKKDNCFVHVTADCHVYADYPLLVKQKWCILNHSGKEYFPSVSPQKVLENGTMVRSLYTVKINMPSLKGDLFPNDVLMLRCEFSFIEGPSGISRLHDLEMAPQPKLLNDILFLLNNGRYTDLTLKIGNEELRVHKCILVSRSEVFARMFEHNMEENLKNCIVIEDFDVTTVKHMLHFVYTGRLYYEDLSTETCKQVLRIADKYDINDLKVKCQEHLMWDLNIENFAGILQIANMCSAAELESFCLEFFPTNAKYILKTPEWKEYSFGLPPLIISLVDKLANSLYPNTEYETERPSESEEVEYGEFSFFSDPNTEYETEGSSKSEEEEDKE